jgi:hypothetical protein
MVFRTLETGIFGRISEGQLIVRIRQIKIEKNPFLKLLFSENVGLQIQILWVKYLKSEKSALFLQM